MISVARIFGVLFVALAGCTPKLIYTCSESVQCDVGGQRGVCQPTGFCSTSDETCAEGWRYVDHASDTYAGECVEYGELLGRWTFDDAAGGKLHDSSGLGNDGDLIGAPVWTSGLIGGALQFDGIDDRVDVRTLAQFGTKSLSAFAWVKSADTTGPSRVLGSTPDPSYFYLDFGAGLPGVDAYDSLHTWWGVAGPGINIADDRWHALAFVFDRERLETRLYLDGLFQTRSMIVGPIGDFGIDGPGREFSIGGQGSSELSLTGTIDDARLYARALGDEEMRALFDTAGLR